MDYDEFPAVLDNSGVDLWTLIDAAIRVASMDHGGELRQRCDGNVERLYSSAPSSSSDRLRNQGREDNTREAKVSGEKTRVSPSTPQSVGGSDSDEDSDSDPYGGLFDDEQKKILEIKDQIEESD